MTSKAAELGSENGQSANMEAVNLWQPSYRYHGRHGSGELQQPSVHLTPDKDAKTTWQ